METATPRINSRLTVANSWGADIFRRTRCTFWSLAIQYTRDPGPGLDVDQPYGKEELILDAGPIFAGRLALAVIPAIATAGGSALGCGGQHFVQRIPLREDADQPFAIHDDQSTDFLGGHRAHALGDRGIGSNGVYRFAPLKYSVQWGPAPLS